jgi:hypothetical protein
LNPFSKPEAPHEDEDILSAIQGLQIEQPIERPEEEGMMEEQAESDHEEDWED